MKLTRTATAGKERRETGDFIGAEGVRKHLKDGPPRRRVGLIVEGAPARRMFFFSISFGPCIQLRLCSEGAKIFEPSGKDLIGG